MSNVTIDYTLTLRYRTPVIFIKDLKAIDRSLLVLLMDDEREWQRREAKGARLKNDIAFPYYRLRATHSYDMLQKLYISHKLFYKDKPLLPDFFSRLSLEYLAEGFSVHALLNNQNLHEYELILQGSPHIAIKESRLSFIDPNVSWQELAPFLQGPHTFTKQDYLKFKKDIDISRLIELSTTEVEQPPTLQLVDGTCSFAKLEDKKLESELLKAGFIKKEMGNSNYFCPTDRSLAAVLSLLKAGWKVLNAQGKELVYLTELRLNQQQVPGRFQIGGTLRFQDDDVDVATCAKSQQQHDRLLDLPSGKCALLAFDAHNGLQEMLMEVELVSGTLQLAKNRLATLLPLAESLGLEAPRDLAATSAFTGILRPYQQQGLNWMLHLHQAGLNGLLADEMGLGKTVQVLAFLSHLTSKALIVVPTSLLYNWKREVEHFLPSKSCAIYHGTDRELEDADIIITSYGILRSDLNLLTKHSFGVCVLDEAQNIKNSSTATTHAALQIRSSFRLALTGTPVENSSLELVTIFRFLEPDLELDRDNLPVLRKTIAPFLLRRKKSEVAKDLPEKIEEIVYVQMEDEQERLYSSFLSHTRSGLLKKVSQDGVQAHRMEIFEAILRLRQIACHPMLVPQLVESLAPQATISGKCELVLQDIETLLAEGKKVVLFSQFTSMLDILAKNVEERGWNYLLLKGETRDRQSLVDTFQNDPNYPLFLISLKAGGVGLNLTAADYVLLYDPWWNRAQEAQAIDRAHRIGRKEAVFSKRYVTQGTIEEKILELQEKKAQIAEILLENGAASLSPDEVIELLSERPPNGR